MSPRRAADGGHHRRRAAALPRPRPRRGRGLPGRQPARDSPEYERYDWNSLLADEEGCRAIMPTVMDGTSYFPSRPEMERGLVTFAERTALSVRYGCTWEATRRLDNQEKDIVLETSDGEYRAPTVVFAVGVAEPWRPAVLELEGVQQYGDLRSAASYRHRRVFIVGKH